MINAVRYMAIAALLVLLPIMAQAAELVMFEQDACEWCEAWDEDIGVVYGKTPEGRQAPLRRVDIFEDRPSDLVWLRGARFTPTFVLIENGREIGRIDGYPGEDFFWGLLGELLQDLPAPNS